VSPPTQKNNLTNHSKDENQPFLEFNVYFVYFDTKYMGLQEQVKSLRQFFLPPTLTFPIQKRITE